MITNDLQMVVILIVSAVGLFFLAGYAEKVKSSMWRLLYLIPALIAFFFVWLAGFELALIPAYIAAVLVAAGFLYEKVSIRRITCLIGAGLTAFAILLCNVYPGYRMPDFVAEFENAFATMREHYCLTEHKGIDWDILHEKYRAKFESANKNHDKVENLLAWVEFTGEFYDGHVYYSTEDEEITKEAGNRAYGNDFGLSLVLLSDGRVAAANVESGSEAQKAGLYNGAIVTLWDGKDPKELAKDFPYPFMNMPDAGNEEFYNMLAVAGMGDEQVTVDFVDKDGNAKQVRLQAQGYYYERFKATLETIDQGMNIGTLTFHVVNEDTVLYRIKGMSYDQKSYMNGDHSQFKEELRQQILKYREEGMKNLIIDLRCNGGGSPQMIMAMAELLGSEDSHFYCQSAVLDEKTCKFMKEETTGKYLVCDPISFTGENLWGDGKIILLVNGQCISAGDHFVQVMGDMDNVTVAGLTKSNASGQAICSTVAAGGVLTFSSVPSLDENGEIYIDTGKDHKSNVAFDVQIPLDSAAVSGLFDDGEDYALNYVVENLLK